MKKATITAISSTNINDSTLSNENGHQIVPGTMVIDVSNTKEDKREILLVVGGANCDTATIIEYYNEDAQKWRVYFNINKKIADFASCILEENLLIIGGLSNGNDLDTAYSLNIRNRELSILPSMNEKRSNCTATVINNNVYVCGGYSRNSVEAWNPSRTSWQKRSSMKWERVRHAAVTWKGKLYVFGGVNDKNVNSSEVYDPQTDEWSELPPMTVVLNMPAAAVFRDQIFIIGGYSKEGCSDKIYQFDLITNIWSDVVQNLPKQIAGASAIASNGKLFISGGFSESYLNEVYEFSLKNGARRKHSNLVHKRSDHALLTIPKKCIYS